jgi:hypothetical protein
MYILLWAVLYVVPHGSLQSKNQRNSFKMFIIFVDANMSYWQTFLNIENVIRSPEITVLHESRGEDWTQTL